MFQPNENVVSTNVVALTSVGLSETRSTFGIDVIVTLVRLKVLRPSVSIVPIYTPLASTPRVSSRENPLLAGYSTAFQVPTGSLVSDRATSTGFPVSTPMVKDISTANHRLDSGSKVMCGSKH